MFTEIRQSIRPALSLLVLFTLVTGLAYPLAVTGLAQLAMPEAANGSLITQDGRIVGSRLIGQNFASPGYFHGRPSAAGSAGYDADNSSGSNLAPGAKALRDRVAADVGGLRKAGVTGPIPADLVTTSASGLDPDISPASALLQAPRVARARGLPLAAVRDLVMAAERQPLAGVLGEPRVNVLLLNIQLDRMRDKQAR